MPKRKRNLGLALLQCCLLTVAPRAGAARCPADVPPKFERYFVHCVDRRSLTEKALNLIGLTSEEVGRSFALVAGVDTYPNLSGSDRMLEPAAVDLARLEAYLKDQEFFDEIVVLRNEAVTLENLTYFLQAYFPTRLRQFPNSRFLFAYSGHGVQEGPRGYLLESDAADFSDRYNRINMRVLATLYEEIVDSAYHSLVLINACHSGAFFKRSAGSRRLLPKGPGHHAITAGGSTERSWHNEDVGPGSIFFEKLFAGLFGRADRYPEQPDGSWGDGIVTVGELATYLRQEVQIETNQSQNPRGSDISRNGSLGSFFFLDRRRQVQAGIIKDFDPGSAIVRPLGIKLEEDASAFERERVKRAREILGRARLAHELDEAWSLARPLADIYRGWLDLQQLAGEIAYRSSRWEEAAVYLGRGLDTPDGARPTRPELFFYLAVALFESGRPEEATVPMERALPYIERTPFVQSYVNKILQPTVDPTSSASESDP